MNKETILAMEPGRELNEAVGINVFGKKGLELMSEFLPDYSGSMAAAWEVVEKLREDENLKIVLEAKLFKGWYVCFKNDMGGNVTGKYEFAADAPEAICKAALIATLEANHET